MQDCKVTQFYFGFWRPDGALPHAAGAVCTIFPPQGGRPSDLRAQAAGVEAPVNAQLQGPSDPGTQRREGEPGRGLNGSDWGRKGGESRREDTESKNTESEGGPVPFLPTRSDAKLIQQEAGLE